WVVPVPGDLAERVGHGGEPARRVVGVARAVAERVDDLDEVPAPVVVVPGRVAQRVRGGGHPAGRVGGVLPPSVPVGDGDQVTADVVGVGAGTGAGAAVPDRPPVRVVLHGL